MASRSPAPVNLNEGRFARLEAIEWWDQALLSQAKVLVVGAGALGNEIIKNLALLGVGHVIIADMDRIELSNLSRSVLYRAEDEGELKAVRAARAATDIFPDITALPLCGNVLGTLGLGCFRWADVVLGALDNREARVFINSACAQVGTPWIDGGIEVLQGIVRGFSPPSSACYECTMGKVDWELLNRRRSCSLLARRAIQERGTPTTPTTASVIAGIQVQEAVKLLHGRDDFLGNGFFFDGGMHQSYPIAYAINPDCPWHEDAPPASRFPDLGSEATPFQRIWAVAERALGGLTELEFSRELVTSLSCPGCGSTTAAFRPLVEVSSDDAWCQSCNAERTPSLLHRIGPDDTELLSMTPLSVGLPRWDIVWARHGTEYLGIELAGDAFISHGLS